MVAHFYMTVNNLFRSIKTASTLLQFFSLFSLIEIEFIGIKGDFGPELIHDLSKQWSIPVNFMFIGSPDDRFSYRG
jgi:hypothetical protein